MELSQLVQKYRAMESTWKAQKARLEPAAFTWSTTRAKRIHPYEASDHKPVGKKNKPLTGHKTVLDKLLFKPYQIHATLCTEPNAGMLGTLASG